MTVEVVSNVVPGPVQTQTVRIAPGSTIQQLLDRLIGPGKNFSEDAVSVWGHRRALDFVLRDGDRVEITRALWIDPKTARARRVDQRPRRGWVARKIAPSPPGP